MGVTTYRTTQLQQITPKPRAGLVEHLAPGGPMGPSGENSRTKVQNVVTHSGAYSAKSKSNWQPYVRIKSGTNFVSERDNLCV